MAELIAIQMIGIILLVPVILFIGIWFFTRRLLVSLAALPFVYMIGFLFVNYMGPFGLIYLAPYLAGMAVITKTPMGCGRKEDGSLICI
jgi:hypothetical protein